MLYKWKERVVGGFGEYAKYDGLGLAELVRTKEITPRELVEEAIDRIEKLNPHLNAVIHTMYDLALKAVDGNLPSGPFKGVPFLLKDLTATYAGAPMHSGSRFHKGFVPKRDCELVKRYKATGVIVLGKTNTPEYGLMPVTEPELFGPSNNPWDLTRTTGGSSGGSAAAVASLMVPLAHGNDGGGSIRIPASCCGVFGLKPTRARTPFGPDLGNAWHGLACGHILSRSVRDSAAMLDATSGPDIGAPHHAPPPARPFLEEVGTDPGKLRIAFTAEPFRPAAVHDDCVKGLEATVTLCRDLGHELMEDAPQIDGQAFERAYSTIICGEIRAAIEEMANVFGRRATSRDFEPVTWAAGLLGNTFSASDFAKAVHVLNFTTRQVCQFFEEYDVLLTPALARPPVMTGELQPQGVEAFALKLLGRLNAGRLISTLTGTRSLGGQFLEFTPYTPLFNATGQPAMSVPLHWNDEGLPIGMHFVGRYGDEATLFRLAGQLERVEPWFDRNPPVNSLENPQ